MFYDTEKMDHGLPHDPFKAIVAPRPIGWITSVSAEGNVNLAPYSYFNAISTRPPCVMFASESYKHTVENVSQTGEFVCNLATWSLRNEVNQTSATLPRDVNEMEVAGLDPAPCVKVAPPRVGRAPCALECRVLRIMELEDLERRPLGRYLVFGQVVGVYIDDAFLRDGVLDTAALQPIARCGYRDYAVVESLFQMHRPS